MKEKQISDIIRIINVLAFVFTILNSIFALFSEGSTNSFFFAWIVSNLIFFHLKKKKQGKWKYIVSVVMLLPMIYFRNIFQLLFLGITVGVAIFILLVAVENYRYSTVMDQFKESIFVIVLVYGISLLIDFQSSFDDFSAPYVFIYLITSILLLRTLRYMERGGKTDKLNKVNYQTAIGIILLSFSLSNQYVLSFFRSILSILKSVYDHVILTVVSWFVFLLGVFYNLVFIHFDLFNRPKEGIIMKGTLELAEEDGGIPYRVAESLNTQLILNIFLGILILLFIYALLRIYVKQSRTEVVGEEYTESREFIFNEREKDKSLFKRFADFIKPKSNEEKIRLYYKKFLEFCKAQDITIVSSDTSQDVNRKARYIFDPMLMENMRKIYIQVRYSQHKVDTATYHEFMGYYKELNKSSKSKAKSF